MTTPKWCTVTTTADLSLPYFLASKTREVDVYLYSDVSPHSLRSDYDVIYFRDPFNEVGYDVDIIKSVVDKITERYTNAYFVDGITKFEDMLFEDKWVQYGQLKQFMPRTSLYDGTMKSYSGIAKERISSRARGIYFSPTTLPPSECGYVLQESVVIKKEYRVYVNKQVPIDTVGVRISKTETANIHMSGYENLAEDLHGFIREIVEATPRIDFAGIDVAETPEGYKLLEVNRSPQFRRFNQITTRDIGQDMMNAVEASLAIDQSA